MRDLALLLAALLLAAQPALAQRPCPGDPRQGAALAESWCSGCHVVSPGPSARGTDAVPSFPDVARNPAKGPDYVATFLANPYPAMPPIPLSCMAVNDIVAYFRNLQRDPD